MLGGRPARQGGAGGSSNYNKPVPPPPQPRPQEDPYRRPSGPPQSGGYGASTPGAYNAGPPPPQQSYSDFGRSNSTRYDTYQAAPQSSRYGGQQGGYGGAPPPAASRNHLTSPPPPSSYGQGPPPSSHNRPPIPEQQRPPTVAPRDGSDRDALWPLFLQVDKDRSGQLSETELRRALVNGDYTAFDPHTVKMMIRMFDTDRSGTINFDEFCGLWGFLAAWRGLFDRFDVDRSGNISLREFEDALVAFGYRLSPQFVQLLFGTYARSHSRGRGDEFEREKVLSFDLFVQACISLKRMTDVFKKYDSDRDGYITLSL